jgi:hypothetical protein
MLYIRNWECGGIGRHDGLKIRCLVIGLRVQVPPFSIKNQTLKMVGLSC